MTAFLDIVRADKSFGSVHVLKGVDLAVGRGEFVSLLGPSGCGKTTLLRIVAGLHAPDDGTVTLDRRNITNEPPHLRDVGVVFQNYALFPHLTVAENVAFGLEARNAPRASIMSTVERYLSLVHMSEFADRSVRALSGGQQQRVAVARALAVKPKLLLLDEPFSALDRKLRETMQIELKRLLRELSTTAVFVTHDQDEALMMSDRIAVMNRGAIEQLGSPHTIYFKPETPFVLGFVGLSTRMSGVVIGNTEEVSHVETPYGTLTGIGRVPVGHKCFVAVRPERVRLLSRTGDDNTIRVSLRDIVFQGSKVQLYCDAVADDLIIAEGPELGHAEHQQGREVQLHFATADAIVFPELLPT